MSSFVRRQVDSLFEANKEPAVVTVTVTGETGQVQKAIGKLARHGIKAKAGAAAPGGPPQGGDGPKAPPPPSGPKGGPKDAPKGGLKKLPPKGGAPKGGPDDDDPDVKESVDRLLNPRA